MRSRQPLPRLWLMTDERLGDGLIDAVAAAAEGAGIVFRHYRLDGNARRALFDRVRAAAPRRCCCSPARRLWRGLGRRRQPRPRPRPGPAQRSGPRSGRRSAPPSAPAPLSCSSRRSIATRSHPDARPLGPGALRLARAAHARCPSSRSAAWTPRAASRLASFGAYGWAAIDAWRDEACLEAESRADIDRLAVAAVVAGQRVEPVARDAVAHAGGHIEVAARSNKRRRRRANRPGPRR